MATFANHSSNLRALKSVLHSYSDVLVVDQEKTQDETIGKPATTRVWKVLVSVFHGTFLIHYIRLQISRMPLPFWRKVTKCVLLRALRDLHFLTEAKFPLPRTGFSTSYFFERAVVLLKMPIARLGPAAAGYSAVCAECNPPGRAERRAQKAIRRGLFACASTGGGRR